MTLTDAQYRTYIDRMSTELAALEEPEEVNIILNLLRICAARRQIDPMLMLQATINSLEELIILRMSEPTGKVQ